VQSFNADGPDAQRTEQPQGIRCSRARRQHRRSLYIGSAGREESTRSVAANKRKPIRIVLDPDAHPVAKGNLCGQHAGFNLHAATRVAVPRDFGTDSPRHLPLALRARPSPTTSRAD
jgi:hypothetical protein